jgi:hypothetical protein
MLYHPWLASAGDGFRMGPFSLYWLVRVNVIWPDLRATRSATLWGDGGLAEAGFGLNVVSIERKRRIGITDVVSMGSFQGVLCDR